MTIDHAVWILHERRLEIIHAIRELKELNLLPVRKMRCDELESIDEALKRLGVENTGQLTLLGEI